MFNLKQLQEVGELNLYVTTPNRDYLSNSAIRAFERKSTLYFNDMSYLSFKVYKTVNGSTCDNYEHLKKDNLIEAVGLGWYQIVDVEEASDGRISYLQITCRTCENELTSKHLTSFGQLGIEDDEQGGLDRYCLYNVADVDHSILHIVQKEAPSWSIGFIDPDITKEYRSFSNDRIDIYSFLTKDVSEAFECIFQFDTVNQLITAHKPENLGKETSIYLSYDNLLKETKKKADFDGVKTRLSVFGGDDRGSTLNIVEVNPAGTSDLIDISYYREYMTDGLLEALDRYTEAYNSSLASYRAKINDLKTLELELDTLLHSTPTDPNNTSLVDCGLHSLQAKYDSVNESRQPYINAKNKHQKQKWANLTMRLKTIENALNAKKKEVLDKTQEIVNQKTAIKNSVVLLRDYLTFEQLKELSKYIKDETYTNSHFVVTKTMTEDEILTMKQDLMELAQKELAKISKPRYTVEISSENFLNIPQFKTFAKQVEMGCMLYVDFGDYVVNVRLMKMEIDWEDKSNFYLTISNKNTLDELEDIFEEMRTQASSASSTLSINQVGYNNSKKQVHIIDELMNNTYNAALRKLQESDKQEFLIDNTGLHLRKRNSDDSYSNEEIWLTQNQICFSDDNFETVKLALGNLTVGEHEMYGLNAEVIIGKLIMGSNLYLQNADNSLTFNEDGLTMVTEEGNDLTINRRGFDFGNNLNRFKINPKNNQGLLEVTKGNESLLYLDNEGNLKIKANLEASTGTFEGDISGSSATFTKNNSTLNINKEFLFEILKGNEPVLYVDNQGNLRVKADITGSTGTFSSNINIADNFKVDSNGNVNMQGGIVLGGDITWKTPPILYQYSRNNQHWHSNQRADDIYRRESLDGGRTWKEGYQFIGSDGSDANVPPYVQWDKLGYTNLSPLVIETPELRSPKIYAKEVNLTTDKSIDAVDKTCSLKIETPYGAGLTIRGAIGWKSGEGTVYIEGSNNKKIKISCKVSTYFSGEKYHFSPATNVIFTGDVLFKPHNVTFGNGTIIDFSKAFNINWGKNAPIARFG